MENVKQNTMKYKILFIFSFLLLFLLLFNTNVFASFDFECNGVSHSVPDIPVVEGYSNYLIDYDGSGSYYCFLVPDGSIVKYQFNGNSYDIVLSSGNFKKYFSNTPTKWEYVSQPSYAYQFASNKNYQLYEYHTSPIYDEDGTTILFQPPVQSFLAKVLVKTQENNPKLVLVEIAKIVTLILAVVVSLVGFRKAWKLLRTSLNRS